MYKNPYTSEQTYTLDEAAHILAKSRADIEGLIRQQRLGFEMTEYGPVITNSHISRYYLGQKPIAMPEYKPEGIKRKREWFEGLITSPSPPTYVGKSEFYVQTLDVVQTLE